MRTCDVSVVIPAHNRGRTLTYCLNSVVRQTLAPKEIIVVDDASTDCTAEIMKEFVKQDTRIKYSRLERQSGAQVARNRGIKAATCGWVAFLDSDDEWVEQKLEKQWAQLAQVNFAPMTFIYSDCFKYEVAVDRKSIWSLPKIRENAYRFLLKYPSPMFQSILTSKRALETIEYLDENIPSFQEWDTSIRLSKCCNVVHMQEPLFIYYLHEGITISQNGKRTIEGYQYIIDKFKCEIIDEYGLAGWQDHIKMQLDQCIKFGLWEQAKEYIDRLRCLACIEEVD